MYNFLIGKVVIYNYIRKNNLYSYLYIMGNLSNYNYNKNHFNINMKSLGSKVKNVVEFGSTLKGIYDVGRTIYTGIQAATPYVLEAALLAGL